MKKYLLLLIIALFPFVVSAADPTGANLSIDSNGNLTSSIQGDSSSYYEFDGHDLKLKKSNFSYTIPQCDWDLNIILEKDSYITTLNTTKDIVIEGNNHKLTFLATYSTNSSSNIEFNNVDLDMSAIYFYNTMTYNNVTGNVGHVTCNGDKDQCVFTANDSNIMQYGMENLTSFNLNNTTLKGSTNIMGNPKGFIFNMNKAIIPNSDLYITFNNQTNSDGVSTIKDSELHLTQLQAIYSTRPKVVIEKSIVEGRFLDIITEASESTLKLKLCGSSLKADKSEIDIGEYTRDNDSYIILDNSILTGSIETNTGGRIEISNSDVNLNNYLHFGSNADTILNNTTFKTGRMNTGRLYMNNSQVESTSFDMWSYIDENNKKITNIINSTIKSPRVTLYGDSNLVKIDNDGNILSGSVINIKDSKILTDLIYYTAGSMIVDNSVLDTKSFKMYGNPGNIVFNDDGSIESIQLLYFKKSKLMLDEFIYSGGSMYLQNSKIITNDNTDVNKIYMKHGYYLNKTNDFLHKDYELESNIISTDIDNNPIQRVCSYEACNEYVKFGSSSVLLRDKSYITFKVVNGTWADGTTDDIVEEYMSFDTFDPSVIPTGMIPNNGYEDGSWDVEVSLEEVDDDYIFTYTFKKKGLVKGIEEITENPKTGIISYSLKCLVLLIVMGFVYFKIYKKTYFMK